jgi:glycosyltransferase involved in cell wall biosynthesis
VNPQPNKLRVCIASQSPVGLTESFITAHIERLPFEIAVITGYHLDYSFEGRSLFDIHSAKRRKLWHRLLNVLPRTIEYRVRRRLLREPDEIDVVADFFCERQIDVVLAEYGTTAAFITPACMRASVPLIAHFHGFDASRIEILSQFEMAYRAMFEYASAVIAVSEAMREALIRVGCPPEKIVVNHYGPNPDFFTVSPDYDSREVLAVGRLTEQKAPHLLLSSFKKAYAERPDLRLRIIGGGELEGICRDLVSALDLESAVFLDGPASREEILESMSRAFLFVQHSVAAIDGSSEGTPVAILEASAAGLPVVSTRHAGIPDIVTCETGILVDERDTYGMAEAILKLSDDRSLARSMGTAGRNRVLTGFTMEKHISTLASTLANAVTRS